MLINLGMLLVDVLASVAGDFASLQADGVDFLGDSADYAISLFVLSRGLRYRAIAALIKGLSMGALGVCVLATIIWHLVTGKLRMRCVLMSGAAVS